MSDLPTTSAVLQTWDRAARRAPSPHQVLFVGEPGRAGLRTEALAQIGGLAVNRVREYASAEALLSDRSADLIVLDAGPNGEIDFAVCHRLAGLCAGPLIVLSDRNSEDDRVLALELGAVDCLLPECGDAERLARIRAAARRTGGATRSQPVRMLAFGGLRLDLDRRELRIDGGGRRRLTLGEFGLLVVFLRNAGRALSKSELRIAACEHEGNHRATIAVKVHRLRRKLGADAVIRTIHGAGYILEADVVEVTGV